MTYGKGPVTNPPKRTGGDSQGRGSKLNTTYWKPQQTRWGETLVPNTDKFTVTTTTRLTKDATVTDYTFTPKQTQPTYSAPTAPVVTPVPVAVAPTPTTTVATPPPQQPKEIRATTIIPGSDYERAVGIRYTPNETTKFKETNLPFKFTYQDTNLPTNLDAKSDRPTTKTVSFNTDGEGNVSKIGTGWEHSVTINAGTIWPNLRNTLRGPGIDARNLGGNVQRHFLGLIDELDKNKKANSTGAANAVINAQNKAENDINIKKNAGINAVLDAAKAAYVSTNNTGSHGEYLKNRNDILLDTIEEEGLNNVNGKDYMPGLEEVFREFYIREKLTPSQYENFVEVPYGDFDSTFYVETQDPEAKEKFDEKTRLDDVDFLGVYNVVNELDYAPKVVTEYNPVNFYRFEYSQRVLAGENVRANEAEALAKYEGENLQAEDIITTKDIEDARSQQLNVTVSEEDELSIIRNNEYFQAQFDAAKSGNPENADYLFWKDLQNNPLYSIEDATGGRIPIYEISDDKPNDFVRLFLKSERTNDKKEINSLMEAQDFSDAATITDLEDKINELIGEEQLRKVSQFGQLTKDALKETVAEIKNQKAKEQNMAFYKGLGSFSEIFNAGKTISESFLNDTGIGGILPMSDRGRSYAKKLGDKLEGATGINNSVEYNWENWFQDALSKKYSPNYEENKEEYQPFEIKEGILEAFTRFLNRNLGVDPFNQDTGQFNELFLERAGFNTTEELIDYLNNDELNPEESKEILKIITSVSPNRNNVEEYSNYIKEAEDLIEAQRNKIDALDKEYNNNLEIDGITEEVAGRFAREFVNDYLKPRFDTSRSMDEFIEYMDVRQKDKNPFQTEDLAFALRNAGQIQAENYLKELEGRAGETSKFNTEFYFDPLANGARVNPEREQVLQEQRDTVNNDWEEAQDNEFKNKIPKEGENLTWYQQAYRYGLGGFNENGKWTLSKDDFAQLHFQLVGKWADYDPALDLLNATIISDKAQSIVDDYLADKAQKIGSVFGRFITPEEFADEMLEGVDPYDDRYDEILESLGLEDFKGTIEDLRGYIVDIMRTGAAKEIRENIKFLNEQREDPSQEILGITYIDRPEDYSEGELKGKTWLFESFQKSGYEGTEDEFYDTFLPDVERSEMELISEVQSGKGLEFGFGLQESLSDPLAAYANIAQLTKFEDEEEKEQQKVKTTSQRETSVFNVFDLGYEDDEDTYQKSPSAQEFLGEFAPFFK